MWDFRGKIRNLSFLKHLNFGAKQWFSTKNSITELLSQSETLMTSLTVESQLRWVSSLNLSKKRKTTTRHKKRRQKSEFEPFESINIFDILENIADLIEIMQRLIVDLQSDLRKKLTEDLEFGAIWIPKCESLVIQNKLKMVDNSGKANRFS